MQIGILAADRRMEVIAARLSAHFPHVTLHTADKGIEPLEQDDVIVFPLPMRLSPDWLRNSKEADPVEEILRRLPADKLLLGGSPASLYVRLAEEYGSVLIDYYDDETVLMKNAVPTAEAALSIAVEKLPCTIWNNTFAITGYGKCARALAIRLLALGGKVTAAARREAALTEAALDGCNVMALADFLSSPPPVRCLYNTVPATVFPDDFCDRLPENTLLVELAGVHALPVSDRVLYAPGLPGKTAPETAGEILADAILPLIYRYQQTHLPSPLTGRKDSI